MKFIIPILLLFTLQAAAQEVIRQQYTIASIVGTDAVPAQTWSGSLGWRFAVDANVCHGIVVTHVAIYDGGCDYASGTMKAAIYNSAGTQISGTLVTLTTPTGYCESNFRYIRLANPVFLAANTGGTFYQIVGYGFTTTANGNCNTYYAGSDSAPDISGARALTFVNGWGDCYYGTGTGDISYPSSGDSNKYHCASFKYTIRWK